MSLFRDKNDFDDNGVYSGNDSKDYSFIDVLSQSFSNILSFLKINRKKDDDMYSLYDNDIGGMDFSEKLINIVFIIYGILAGVICCSYSGYMCTVFASFAAGEMLISTSRQTTPLTIVVSSVIILGVYIASLIIGLFIYFIVSFLFSDVDKFDIQVSFSYAIFLEVLFSIITFVIPGNMFLLLI